VRSDAERMTIEAPSEPPLVIVADDDEDILSLVSFRLQHSGFRVLQARNGVEAIRVTREHSPSLIVLDVMMPRLDGHAVLRELRHDDRTRRIPVILLTARVRDADVVRGFEEGADDYLKKPFSPEELVERVRALLSCPQ